MEGGAEVSLTPRQLWIRRVETRSGIAPLDFKMARYIELMNITNMQDLRWSLTTTHASVHGIGAGTLDKLKALAGMTVPPKRVTWKREALRLYALLEQHGIEYVKQK
jgi:hypothetical protein